jgi:hypothetical protein
VIGFAEIRNITNMEDVLALYEKPYTARSVHRTAAPTI